MKRFDSIFTICSFGVLISLLIYAYYNTERNNSATERHGRFYIGKVVRLQYNRSGYTLTIKVNSHDKKHEIRRPIDPDRFKNLKKGDKLIINAIISDSLVWGDVDWFLTDKISTCIYEVNQPKEGWSKPQISSIPRCL